MQKFNNSKDHAMTLIVKDYLKDNYADEEDELKLVYRKIDKYLSKWESKNDNTFYESVIFNNLEFYLALPRWLIYR